MIILYINYILLNIYLILIAAKICTILYKVYLFIYKEKILQSSVQCFLKSTLVIHTFMKQILFIFR